MVSYLHAMPGGDDISDASESRQPVRWAESELPRQPQPLPSQPEPQPPPRLPPVNRNQLLWHAVDVEKRVGPDHWVRAIWELVGQLDLKGYRAEVGSVEGVAGRPAYDPRLLISLWIYAYSQKVGGAREVARRGEYDPAFQWLTGMQVVNYHTLADFRLPHPKALDALFAPLLGVLRSEGLVSLEQGVHEGTKVQASARGKSFHREKTLREHLEAGRERVGEMGDAGEEESSRGAAGRERAARQKVERLELALKEMEKVQAAPQAKAEPSQGRVSETDPEAHLMKQRNGGCTPRHNVQISTDTAHSIMVGASLTQAANDQHEMVAAITEVERQRGQQPEQFIVDQGYRTRENMLAAAEMGVDLMGSGMEPNAQAGAGRLLKRGVDPAFYPDKFPYHAATNTCTGPAGKQLSYETTKRDRVGVERKVYKAGAKDCRHCEFRQRCQPGKHGRRILGSENVPRVAEYLAKMQTEAAQALYRWRGPVAEFSNLWLKAKLGLWQFSRRGLPKVRGEVL